MEFEFDPVLKDPGAIQQHGMDWTAWLQDGETITGTPEVVSDDPALLIDNISHSAGIVRWRVREGIAGTNYAVTCKIQTSDGRADERSLQYKVRER